MMKPIDVLSKCVECDEVPPPDVGRLYGFVPPLGVARMYMIGDWRLEVTWEQALLGAYQTMRDYEVSKDMLGVCHEDEYDVRLSRARFSFFDHMEWMRQGGCGSLRFWWKTRLEALTTDERHTAYTEWLAVHLDDVFPPAPN